MKEQREDEFLVFTTCLEEQDETQEENKKQNKRLKCMQCMKVRLQEKERH